MTRQSKQAYEADTILFKCIEQITAAVIIITFI